MISQEYPNLRTLNLQKSDRHQSHLCNVQSDVGKSHVLVCTASMPIYDSSFKLQGYMGGWGGGGGLFVLFL